MDEVIGNGRVDMVNEIPLGYMSLWTNVQVLENVGYGGYVEYVDDENEVNRWRHVGNRSLWMNGLVGVSERQSHSWKLVGVEEWKGKGLVMMKWLSGQVEGRG